MWIYVLAMTVNANVSISNWNSNSIWRVNELQRSLTRRNGFLIKPPWMSFLCSWFPVCLFQYILLLERYSLIFVVGKMLFIFKRKHLVNRYIFFFNWHESKVDLYFSIRWLNRVQRTVEASQRHKWATVNCKQYSATVVVVKKKNVPFVQWLF